VLALAFQFLRGVMPKKKKKSQKADSAEGKTLAKLKEDVATEPSGPAPVENKTFQYVNPPPLGEQHDRILLVACIIRNVALTRF